ncbi:hypothetical protein COP2_043311 [Malus domestica]
MKHKLKENIHIDVENFLHILQVLTLREKCQYFKTWTSNYWIPSACSNSICKHLTLVLYAKNDIIFHEGELLAKSISKRYVKYSMSKFYLMTDVAN